MDFSPEERQRYIGGSDISAIMDLNPWKTVHDVFIEKVKENPTPFKTNEAMYWGKNLEESIADRWLSERLSNETDGDYNITRASVLSTGHPTKDYIRGHPDAIYKGWKQGKPITCFLEVKTTDSRNASNWTHTAPPYYFVQLAWYAMINTRNYEHIGDSLPYTEYWFAVLIGGNNYKEFQVDIDSNDMGLVESKGTEFWEDHVQKKLMPAYKEPDEKINAFLHPYVSKDTFLKCDKFVNDYVKEFRSIKSAIKNLQTKEKKMKEFIKNKMGDFQFMMYENEKIATQSEYCKTSTDWEFVARNYEADSEFFNHVKNHTKSVTIKSLR